MDFSKNLLWLYPAYAMTAWTVVTALLAWTLPLRSRMPSLAAVHAMCFILNPKDDFLYQRPSLVSVLAFLVAGWVPVVGALLLAMHLLASVLYGVEALKRIGKPKPEPKPEPRSEGKAKAHAKSKPKSVEHAKLAKR